VAKTASRSLMTGSLRSQRKAMLKGAEQF
jgi:hypothetical protein